MPFTFTNRSRNDEYMVDIGTLAMAVFGFVSLNGYLLLGVVFIDYVWFQRLGRSTPVPNPVSKRVRSIRVGTTRRVDRLRPDGDRSDRPVNRCPTCGAENDPSFQFCERCVSKLTRPD